MSKLLLLLVSASFFSSVAAQSKLSLPVILPPFKHPDQKSDLKNDKWGTCLFYLENLGVTVFNKKDQSPSAWAAVITTVPAPAAGAKAEDTKAGPHKFNWADDFVSCPPKRNEQDKNGKTFVPQNFTIKVQIEAGEDVEAKTKDKSLFTLKKGNYYFTLIFETISGYGWKLTDVQTEGFTVSRGKDTWLNGDLTVKAGSADKNTVSQMDIGAYSGYNYGCSNTRVAIFNSTEGGDDVKVGVFFGNIQFQDFNYLKSTDGKEIHFSQNTTDCVGTFTHGSFMGIIVALILASALVFGFLMLNSVQTGDRFDDPKQKQMIINAKE